MIISRKRFEREVRERVELELKNFYEMRDREERERKIFEIVDSLQTRIIKIEEKIGGGNNGQQS